VTERLIIRLASEASHKNHWLIWSESENEIIASGQVANAEQLNLLTEKAEQRVVICLLPGVDICIKKIAINGAFNRQMQQALPYLVEEELASDVEKLHFSVIAKQTDLLHVAICDKQKMSTWLAWLKTAQIICKQFIPEGLTLPLCADGKWQAVQLENQWIVRESIHLAWSCEQAMLNLLLESQLGDKLTQEIESYSPHPDNLIGQWTNHEPVLSMELLAKGTLNNKINLLSGEFKPKKERNQQLDKWRMPAILTVVLFILLMINIHLQSTQLEKQTQLVKQHVETIYKQAFPLQGKLKYVRIKKKLKTMLIGLEGDNAESGFLSMLNELVPAFANNPQLQPSSLKFDGKKQEMRILVNGNNFQSFEKFSAFVPDHFIVEQGALNSSNDRVSGLLTIRKR
jgi:general secretion pathway protein L